MPRAGGVAAAADADGAGDGIYRPPKLNPAAMQVGHLHFWLKDSLGLNSCDA